MLAVPGSSFGAASGPAACARAPPAEFAEFAPPAEFAAAASLEFTGFALLAAFAEFVTFVLLPSPRAACCAARRSRHAASLDLSATCASWMAWTKRRWSRSQRPRRLGAEARRRDGAVR